MYITAYDRSPRRALWRWADSLVERGLSMLTVVGRLGGSQAVARGVHVPPTLCDVVREGSPGLRKTATFTMRGEEWRRLLNVTQFMGHSRESLRFRLVLEE